MSCWSWRSVRRQGARRGRYGHRRARAADGRVPRPHRVRPEELAARPPWLPAVDVATGASEEEATRRFFDRVHAIAGSGTAARRARASHPVRPPVATAQNPQVLGLFPDRAARDERRHHRLWVGQLALRARRRSSAPRARRAGGRIAVTSDPERCARADRIVLPGVGAFADCRRGLDAVPGMVEALEESVRRGAAVPRHLRRHAASGRARAGVVSPGARLDCRRRDAIEPSDPALKIPHMGWNTLDVVRPSAAGRHRRRGRTDCTPISCTPSISPRASRPTSWPRRLWRAGDGHRRPRQHRRHTVPPREEPDARPRLDHQLPEVAALGSPKNKSSW